MPDTSHQRERMDDFERNAPRTGGRKGGVLPTRNKKSYTVNIRPTRWNDRNKPSQFWKGITDLAQAMFLADTIFHYCGKPRFHFRDDPFPFPRLSCMGNFDTTPDQRSRYVQSIAGAGYRLQREAFIQQVMNVTESPEFIQKRHIFLNLRNVQVAAPPPLPPPPPPADEAAADNPSPADEVAADNPSPTHNSSPAGEAAAAAAAAASASASATDGVAADSSSPADGVTDENSSPTDEAGRDEEREAPLEEDLHSAAMVRGFVASSQGAAVASFEFNMEKFDAGRPGKLLESAEQPLGPECYSLNDCSAVEDKDWKVALEDLDKKSAMAAPNGPPPPPVFTNVTFVRETHFVVLEHDTSEESELAIARHGQSHGPLSCPPSRNTASLMQSCELNHPSVMSESDAQLKSAKRQKIQD